MDAENIKQRITRIEEEIRETPYHKATEHHIGRLKARLAKLRGMLEPEGGRGRGGGKQFAVKKSGDASVVLVGIPSVGKSTLLNKLANTQSKTAAYPFTTVDVIPGMMVYNGAKIQIFDIPGLLTGASSGRGKGKKVLSAVRGSDLIILMASAEQPETLASIENELEASSIRLNQSAPQILIKRKERGGLRLVKGGFKTPSRAVIEGICQEYRLINGEIIFKQDVKVEDLIDVLASNRVYLPVLKIVNKIDKLTKIEVSALKRFLGPGVVFISAAGEIGLEELKIRIWESLGLVKVYLAKGKNELAADREEPMIMQRGLTVSQMAEKISQEMAQEIEGAHVWGKSARFGGQKVGLNHILEDGDVVYLVK